MLTPSEFSALVEEVGALVNVCLQSENGTILRAETILIVFPNRGAFVRFQDNTSDYYEEVIEGVNEHYEWYKSSSSSSSGSSSSSSSSSEQQEDSKTTMEGRVEREVSPTEIATTSAHKKFTIQYAMRGTDNHGFYKLNVALKATTITTTSFTGKRYVQFIMFVPCELHHLPSDEVIQNFIQQAYPEHANNELVVLPAEDGDEDLSSVIEWKERAAQANKLYKTRIDAVTEYDYWLNKPCLIYHEAADTSRVVCLVNEKKLERRQKEYDTRCAMCRTCGKLKKQQL